jgi:hypothetical protein
MVKEKLKSSVDGISTLRKQEEVLRRGEEAVVHSRFQEGEVAILEDEWWPP